MKSDRVAMKDGSGTRVIGYVRVSTEEQEASGAGLEAQRQAITAEATRRGWHLLRIDQDVASGAKADRLGLVAALDSIAAGEADGLIVMKLDRLSRSVSQFSALLERFRDEGWGLVILDIGCDTTTIMGEAMANVAAAFANAERRRIGERTREALAVKRAQGVRLGRPPMELDYVAERAYALRQQGMTLREVARTFNSEGIPTSRGGAQWRASSVAAVLRRKALEFAR
jgi:DNA invertase Pin-like site-specific DNA recombinase